MGNQGRALVIGRDIIHLNALDGGSSPPLATKGWSFSVPPPPGRVLEHSILAFFDGREKGRLASTIRKVTQSC